MSAHNLPQQALIAELLIPLTYNGQAINPDRSPAVAIIITAAAETRTLPAPISVGQELVIAMDTDGGDCVITASAAINMAGNTIMTFDTAGETIRLVAITIANVLRWRVVGNDGVGLS